MCPRCVVFAWKSGWRWCRCSPSWRMRSSRILYRNAPRFRFSKTTACRTMCARTAWTSCAASSGSSRRPASRTASCARCSGRRSSWMIHMVTKRCCRLGR
uniref:(northern house mosquito) hypothetical protein n=1 Tax=Culex pipiens TaxID=7175 RepID=A0A8D8G9B5_CULPI